MKYIFPIALVVVAGILGGTYWMQHTESTSVVEEDAVTIPELESAYSAGESAADDSASPAEVTPAPNPSKPTGYTSAEVAQHSEASSCWTTIEGKVYDLTGWIKQHPGGSRAILSLCGTDGTEAFTRQHGGKARPEQQLASFYIGVAQ